MGPRASLDAGVKEKNSHSLPGLEFPITKPGSLRCTAELSRLQEICCSAFVSGLSNETSFPVKAEDS
jgi:hypothetical protein